MHDLLLLDLDGTLVDSAPDIVAAANAAISEMGREELPAEVVRGFIGDGSTRLLERCLEGSGGEGDVEHARRRFLEHYLEHPCERTTVFPGVVERLASDPARAVVVTNKPLRLALAVLTGVGLARRFALVLGERSLPRHKPAPDPIRFALAVTGVPAERALLVGDGPQDILAARAAGVRVAAAAWGYTPPDRLALLGPDAVLERFADLPPGAAR